MVLIMIHQLSSRSSYALFMSGWQTSLLLKIHEVKTVAHVSKKLLAAVLTLALTLPKHKNKVTLITITQTKVRRCL